LLEVTKEVVHFSDDKKILVHKIVEPPAYEQSPVTFGINLAGMIYGHFFFGRIVDAHNRVYAKPIGDAKNIMAVEVKFKERDVDGFAIMGFGVVEKSELGPEADLVIGGIVIGPEVDPQLVDIIAINPR
jgi:hypothetical protein